MTWILSEACLTSMVYSILVRYTWWAGNRETSLGYFSPSMTTKTTPTKLMFTPSDTGDRILRIFVKANQTLKGIWFHPLEHFSLICQLFIFFLVYPLKFHCDGQIVVSVGCRGSQVCKSTRHSGILMHWWCRKEWGITSTIVWDNWSIALNLRARSMTRTWFFALLSLAVTKPFYEMPALFTSLNVGGLRRR